MSKTKRKTRSDKFPLTHHSTGQYCKKIKGKIYYFGKDEKQALERYLEQAAFLHNGKVKMFKTTNGNMTLKSPCNIYLQHQQALYTPLRRAQVAYFGTPQKNLRSFLWHLSEILQLL